MHIKNISPPNRFRLIDIKCERKVKVNFDYVQFFKDRINHEAKIDKMNPIFNKMTEFDVNKNNESNSNVIMGSNNTDKSYGFNFITTNDDDVYETFLLFDQSKNVYSYPNLDNHKIYQQLETELLSDEKTHFIYGSNNNNIMNYLCTWNLPIEYSKKNRDTANILNNIRTKSETILNADIVNDNRLNNLENINNYEDKFILQGDNIKNSLDELESIKKELKGIKDLQNHPNDHKTKTKHKKFEFIEETIFSTLEYEVIAYFPRQFEALRITYCATYDDFILSVK